MLRITFGTGSYVNGYNAGYTAASRDADEDFANLAVAAVAVAAGVGIIAFAAGIAISSANGNGLVADEIIPEGNLGV